MTEPASVGGPDNSYPRPFAEGTPTPGKSTAPESVGGPDNSHPRPIANPLSDTRKQEIKTALERALERELETPSNPPVTREIKKVMNGTADKLETSVVAGWAGLIGITSEDLTLYQNSLSVGGRRRRRRTMRGRRKMRKTRRRY